LLKQGEDVAGCLAGARVSAPIKSYAVAQTSQSKQGVPVDVPRFAKVFFDANTRLPEIAADAAKISLGARQ
jgi:hypothetical protein